MMVATAEAVIAPTGASAATPAAPAGEPSERVEPGERGERVEQRLFDPSGATLEDAILDLAARLGERGHADCPVCGGRMPAAGGCEDCGSELR